MASSQVNENVRYEPEERPPVLVTIGVGFQFILLTITTMAVVTVVIVRTSEQPESYLTWSFFAALAVAGVCTVIQAVRIRRLGAGYLLIMGPSPVFISVCITALAEGGPALMSSLIVVSSLVQFIVASRLSALRRVITPVVSGCVFMLIAAVVMPSLFELMQDVPADTSPLAGPVTAAVTIAIVIGLALRAPQNWQQWSPLLAILAGWAVASTFGLSTFQTVADAGWVGVPSVGSWPGLDLGFGVSFWTLLTSFIVVTLVSSIIAIGNGVTIQQVSRRTPRATDFRVVQGALNGEGLGNLLSGLAGTVGNTVYPSSISGVSLMGVAARSVGICAGLILLGTALLPKALALLLAIPSPVAATYMVALFSLIFMQGVRTVSQEGLDARKALVVGLSLWIGAAFHFEWLFVDQLTGAWGALLSNGLTSGGLSVILLNAVTEVAFSRRRRLDTELSISALARINVFLSEIASKAGWNETSTQRLCSAGEETLSSLLSRNSEGSSSTGQRLIVNARLIDGAVEMEFLTAPEGTENLEDRMSFLGEQSEVPDESDVPLRLLRHYATSVQHRVYHNIDIITVRVEGHT